jgi:hypothetical protein
MKTHKFSVGDQVRRSRRWWPNCPNVYTIQSCEMGQDNHGRNKLGYRLADPDSPRGTAYLEEELEAAQ